MEMPNTQDQFYYYIEQLIPVQKEWQTERLRALYARFRMLFEQASRLGFSSKFINFELRLLFKSLLPYVIQVEVTSYTLIKENEMEYFLKEFEHALIKREIVEQELLMKSTFSEFYRYNSFPNKPSCVFCERTDHPNYKCPLPKFKQVDAIKMKRLCFSCLKPGHVSRDCMLGIQCLFCGRNHYDYMCNNKNNFNSRRRYRTMGSEGQQSAKSDE